MENIVGNVEYEILDVIAEGGMGTVFKAMEKGASGFEKIVAIKKLLPCYSKDRHFINRFIDEAKLVANLIHENIVQIYQLDKYKDEYYFVLEYVDGVTLYEFMEFHRMSKTRFPLKLAVFIAANVARALAYAHSRHDYEGKPLNIVHCDVCSHNILLNLEGVVKLTDFGVARAVTVKENKSVSGKLPFMSPEQVNKKEVDFHSDIYSLGVVLFYMLSSGRTCRHLDVNPHEIMSQARSNYIDWKLLPSDLDKDLLSILRRMLATEPQKRFHSSAKVAKKLEQYITRTGYGPTSLTLSKYMRHEMPALYIDKPELAGKDTILENEANGTVRIPGKLLTTQNADFVKTHKLFDSGLGAKTRLMSEEEFEASRLNPD